MKIIGLLSWFDEPRDSLLTCLQAMARAGTDHIVAVDGRYALYPADHDVSDPNEYAMILLACRELGMGCTIHQPSGPWEGGEVEKRTFLFQAGWQVAAPGDWFWVQDADQVVMKVPDDFKARLAATEHDAVEVQMLDVVALKANLPTWPPFFQMRALFRAQPMSVQTNHITYMTDDGRLLWGWDGDSRLEPALDLSDVVLVEHRPDQRSHERQAAKLVYYSERDAAGIERGDCELCGAPSTVLKATRWRWSDIGPIADWMECCDEHAAQVDAVNELELRKLGIDPSSVVAGSLLGHAPAPVTPALALAQASADIYDPRGGER